MAKRSLTTDAQVKAEVDGLLGAFGVVAEADADFTRAAPTTTVSSTEPAGTAPSAAVDALWGAPKKR